MSLRDESGRRRVALALALSLLCNVSSAAELAQLELVIDGRPTRRVEGFLFHGSGMLLNYDINKGEDE